MRHAKFITLLGSAAARGARIGCGLILQDD